MANDETKPARKLIRLALIGIPLIAVFAWVLYWHAGSLTIAGLVTNWIEKNAVETDQPLIKVRGFPVSYSLKFGEARWPMEGGDLLAKELKITSKPWAVNSITGQSRTLAWKSDQGVTFDADFLEYETLIDTSGRLSEVDASVTMMRPSHADRPVLFDHADRVDLKLSAIEEETRLDLKLDNMEPVPELQEVLGPNVDFGTEMRLVGELTSARRADIDRWRQAGGVLEVDGMTLIAGETSISLNGTIALDGNLQPIGSGILRARDLDAAISHLEARGLIDRTSASIARLVAALFSRKGNGGANEVEAPVTLQDRQLTIGPVTVAKLAPVIWPE